jgi:hypothetical protein
VGGPWEILQNPFMAEVSDSHRAASQDLVQIAMRDLPSREPIGGMEFHVGEPYVWAQIYYLDSGSDYRECLPHDITGTQPLTGELIFLDDATSFRGVKEFRARWACLLVRLRLWSRIISQLFGRQKPQ